jgi:hypothetical protein
VGFLMIWTAGMTFMDKTLDNGMDKIYITRWQQTSCGGQRCGQKGGQKTALYW